MSNLFQKLHLPLEQQCHISNSSLCDCLCYWDSRHALHLGHAFRRDPFQVLCWCSCHHHIFKCSKTAVKSGFPLGGRETVICSAFVHMAKGGWRAASSRAKFTKIHCVTLVQLFGVRLSLSKCDSGRLKGAGFESRKQNPSVCKENVWISVCPC